MNHTQLLHTWRCDLNEQLAIRTAVFMKADRFALGTEARSRIPSELCRVVNTKRSDSLDFRRNHPGYAALSATLKDKRVSPHVLRHSTAMNLLQHGVDRSVIAMWLGHESMDTTQIYLHSNIELKEKALAKTEPFRGRHGRYRPPDQLLAFLQAL